MKYTALNAAERKALPETYGIPVYEAHTVRQERNRAKDEPTYDLAFESVTSEMATAFNIGLESYGSGIASWKIPQILKANGNANKPAQMWHLYISQVCGAAHTPARINTAWKRYTPAQQQHITTAVNAYLDDCLEHLQENF